MRPMQTSRCLQDASSEAGPSSASPSCEVAPLSTGRCDQAETICFVQASKQATNSRISRDEKFSSEKARTHLDSCYQKLTQRQAEERSRLDQALAAAIKRCRDHSAKIQVLINRFCHGVPAAVKEAMDTQRLKEAAEKLAITARFQQYQQALKQLHEAELADPAAATGLEVILLLGPIALWPCWPVPRHPYRRAALIKQEQAIKGSGASVGCWTSCFKPCLARASSSDWESSTPALSDLAFDEAVEKYWMP